MSVSQRPDTSKSKAATNLSSLAALRARREVQNGGTNPVPTPPAPDDGDAHASAKTKQQPSDKELKRPTSPSKSTMQAQPRPSTGKLPARKGGFFASTAIVSNTVKRAHVADDEDVKEPAPAKKRAKQSAEKGKLADTGKRELPRAAKKDTAYDFSESPESIVSDTKAKGARGSKAAQARGRRGSTAKPADRGRANQSLEAPKRGRGTSRRQNSQSTRPQSQRDSLKARMKAESNGDAIEHRESSVPTIRKTPAVRGTRSGAIVDALGESGAAKGHEETIDDFEASVVQYEPDSDYANGGEVKTVSKSDKRNQGNGPNKEPHVEKKTAPTDKRRPQNGEATAGPCDREQSSPQDLSSRKRQPSAPLEADADLGFAPKRRMPKTPKVFGSSPPAAAASARVMGKAISNKPTVIAFDKDGPQNQGTASARKGAPGSSRTNRSSLPPPPPSAPGPSSSARSVDKVRNIPSETAANLESRPTSRVAAKANVADNVEDVLNDFTKRTSSTEAQPAPKSSSPAAPVPRNEQEVQSLLQPEADDAEFIHIDDFDVPTIAEEEKTAFKRAGPGRLSERTRSQIAMPPPPAPKHSQTAGLGRNLVPPLTAATKSQPVSKDDSIEAKEGVKRPYEEEALDKHVSKRQRASTARSAEAADSLKQSIPANTARHGQHQRVSSQHGQTQMPRNSQNHRPASYGSQKVDIHGSPIPQGMTVKDKETVLEKYSQQARISSDMEIEDEVVAVKTASATTRRASAPSQEIIPPSRQPEPMSSNKKRKPSGPEDESQGIAKVVTANSRRLTIENAAKGPSTDPFTSSDSSRKQSRDGSTSLTFVEHLRQQSQNETIAVRQKQPFRHQVEKKAVAGEGENLVRDQIQKDDISGDRQRSKQQDPDKTLVEDEPEYHSRKRKRAPSLSTVSSDTTRSTGEPRTTFDDLGAWRNALQPHQANLFDELVIVSHRLVRHLVDRETAARDIVDDYRRRGLGLVEEMERNHAREYQRSVDDVQSRKKQLRQEYIDCSDQLKERVAAVEAARQERKQIWSNRDDMVGRLQMLLAEI